jgi:hypothetical protein
MTQCYAAHLFPLTYIRLYFTGSARVTCAAAILNRFLLSGRSFYVASSWFVGVLAWVWISFLITKSTHLTTCLSL